MAQACEVWFYHLERSGPDQVLPELLQKTLQRGWRALVRAGEAARLEALDTTLWTFREESFLPHGLASEPQAARQPVLLGSGEENLNGAQALFLLDDSEPGALEGYERCVILFDGRDEAMLAAARRRWKDLKGAGHPVSYWRQSPEGRWEKQA
jgi:DNA polymerase-3 subunit chi